MVNKGGGKPWPEEDNKRLIALVPRMAPFGWSTISVAMGKSVSSCERNWTKLVRERDDVNDVEVMALPIGNNRKSDVDDIESSLMLLGAFVARESPMSSCSSALLPCCCCRFFRCRQSAVSFPLHTVTASSTHLLISAPHSVQSLH